MHCRGFLEVTSDPASQMLVLSFPSRYLGDKRTAFSQALSLQLSLPAPPLSQLRAYLEVTSTLSDVDPPLVLLFELELNASSGETQMVDVSLVKWEGSWTSLLRLFP